MLAIGTAWFIPSFTLYDEKKFTIFSLIMRLELGQDCKPVSMNKNMKIFSLDFLQNVNGMTI